MRTLTLSIPTEFEKDLQTEKIADLFASNKSFVQMIQQAITNELEDIEQSNIRKKRKNNFIPMVRYKYQGYRVPGDNCYATYQSPHKCLDFQTTVELLLLLNYAVWVSDLPSHLYDKYVDYKRNVPFPKNYYKGNIIYIQSVSRYDSDEEVEKMKNHPFAVFLNHDKTKPYLFYYYDENYHKCYINTQNIIDKHSAWKNESILVYNYFDDLFKEIKKGNDSRTWLLDEVLLKKVYDANHSLATDVGGRYLRTIQLTQPILFKYASFSTSYIEARKLFLDSGVETVYLCAKGAYGESEELVEVINTPYGANTFIFHEHYYWNCRELVNTLIQQQIIRSINEYVYIRDDICPVFELIV